MKSLWKKAAAGAFLAAALFGAGCAPVVREGTPPAEAPDLSYDPAHYPVTVETLDSRGEKREETFERPPRRVAAIWQNSIETLIALGVGDRIIAAMGLPDEKYLRPEYRETYRHIPYTSMENLDVETMLMEEPDLIVGWMSSFGPKTLRSTEFWRGRGVASYISQGSDFTKPDRRHTVEDEYRDILNLGKIFDREEKAREIVGAMKEAVSRAEQRAARQGRRPRGLVIEYLNRDIHVYGEKTLAGDIVRKMGGELLGPELTSISKEQIIEMDPDAVFIVVIESAYGSEEQILDQFREEKALRELRCVKEGRVYALPLYAVYSAGVRTYDGIQIIGKGLYPGMEEGGEA